MSYWEDRKKREEEGVDLSDEYKKTLDEIAGFTPEAFSYDADKDPAYGQYYDKYERSARAAMEDTMTKANARSGGFGNSYAEVAAQQAYNTQMEGVTDIIPELYDLAYGRHQTEQSEKLASLKRKADSLYAQMELEDKESSERLDDAFLSATNGYGGDVWNDFGGGTQAYIDQIAQDKGLNAQETTKLTSDFLAWLDEREAEEADALRDAKAKYGEVAVSLYEQGLTDGAIVSYLENLGLDRATAVAVTRSADQAYQGLKPYLESETDQKTVKATVNGQEVEVSQAEVDEAYSFLVGLMQGSVDEDGNEIAGIDVMARKSYVALLAEDYGISEGALQGAYDKLNAYEQADTEDTHRNAKTLIEDAMAGISDEYYDPTVLGIDAEEWDDMDDGEREDEVLSKAEEMVHRKTMSSNAFTSVLDKKICADVDELFDTEDNIRDVILHLTDVHKIVENIDEYVEDKTISEMQAASIMQSLAATLAEKYIISSNEKIRFWDLLEPLMYGENGDALQLSVGNDVYETVARLQSYVNK